MQKFNQHHNHENNEIEFLNQLRDELVLRYDIEPDLASEMALDFADVFYLSGIELGNSSGPLI
ncbi:MAG: hypothetical protein JNM93_08280 [Bacteriovoracaceae bacterium]|nr:hypothetical protein [Bacteriovoracaceae bacterium]